MKLAKFMVIHTQGEKPKMTSSTGPQENKAHHSQPLSHWHTNTKSRGSAGAASIACGFFMIWFLD